MFFAGIAFFSWLGPPVGASFLLAALTFELGRMLIPAHHATTSLGFELPWWDLPARAVAALAMVLTITTASGELGPNLSGLLAPFPILVSVLVVFTHMQRGATEARVLIRGFLLGFYGFATFSLVLAATLRDVSTAMSFALALAAAALVQLVVSSRASRTWPLSVRRA
jgi:hypothetical protein